MHVASILYIMLRVAPLAVAFFELACTCWTECTMRRYRLYNACCHPGRNVPTFLTLKLGKGLALLAVPWPLRQTQSLAGCWSRECHRFAALFCIKFPSTKEKYIPQNRLLALYKGIITDKKEKHSV